MGPTINGVRPETLFGYDAMSNLTSITDAENRVTTFDPDSFNRVESITYPGPQVESFTYDTAGRLWTRTRGSVTTTYGYDVLNRLTSRRYSDGTPAFAFTYDGNGDIGYLTSASHDSRTLSWDFDLAGQVLSETATSPVAPTSVVSHKYNLLGRREWIKLDTETWLTYEYDAASRLDKIWRGAALFDFSHNDADARVGLAYPNGVTTTYSYDDLWQIVEIAATLGTTPPTVIASTAYTLNDDGTRATKTHPSYNEAYLYDPAGRLREVTRNAGPPTTYTYDKVGNRFPTSWAHNERNELLAMPGYSFTYERGNMTSKTGGGHTWTYEWNAENQLKRITRDQIEVARYQYDPLGRRIERSVAGRVYTYVYDGEDILKEEFSSDLPEPGMIDPPPHRYIHGPGIDEPLAVVHGTGATWYYHNDGLGSPIRVTDGLGAPVYDRQYDEWGNLQGSNIDKEGFAFTAREWNPEAELYYYRARYYDPKISRFISEDPLGFMVDVNFYPYVANNPTTSTDPSGMVPLGSIFPPGACALITYKVFKASPGFSRNNGRRNHCLVSCLIAQQCGKAQSFFAGYAKEAADIAWCVISGRGCSGAGQGDDYNDNSHGRACPVGVSCEDHCGGPQFNGPGEPGPFSNWGPTPVWALE